MVARLIHRQNTLAKPDMKPPRERKFLLFSLEENEYSWRGIWLLALVYLGAIIFAAVASPLVYWAMQSWAETAPNQLNTYLAGKDFPRYFDRLRWLPVILLLPWLLKCCDLFSFKNLGFGALRKSGIYGTALRWTFFGVGLLLLAAAGQGVALGTGYTTGLTPGDVLEILMIGALSGLLVGLIEEAVFRGLILRMFYTALKPIPAVFLSALFFASVHFKKIPNQIWDDESAVITLGSGFYVGFWTLLSVVQTFEPARFLNLFLFGVVLCLLFLRTGSLWPCAGFHGGVVFTRAIYDKCFQTDDGNSSNFWGSGILLDGYFASILLALICLWLLKRSVTTDGHES